MSAIESLGEALTYGWRVHARCLDDGMRGLKHGRECGLRMELDLPTLVCTRGRDFPLSRLAERLRCPKCGCRRMAVAFDSTANDSRRWAVAAKG